MIKNIFGRAKRLLFSLRMGFFVMFIIAMGVGVGVFFLGRTISANYIENVYVAAENKEKREAGYLNDLQRFIDENEISSAETGKISKWAHANQYVYLLIYKDDKIFFTSDDATEKPEKGDDKSEEPDGDKDSEGEESLPDGSEDSEEEKAPDDGVSGDGAQGKPDEDENPGVTIDYPTREELFEYAKKNDMHLIELSDGPLFASFAEFTEYLYYDIANIISLISAALIVVLIMLIYIHRITNRIIRLGKDVNLVAAGDTEHRIRATGSDEISGLASNVDEMRSSLVETLKKEREALDSNTELITSMSHDIRTPLTVLLGYMDVMRQRAEDDEVMHGYIKAAESTALRLKKLSDDMFGYFLVFGGNSIALEMESYDAETLVEQMLSEHVLLMIESGYDVPVDRVGFEYISGRCVRTDAQQLVRIFDNAFSNLYKYADKACPIKITVKGTEKEMSVEFVNAVRNDGERVESNGIGLKTCAKLSEMIGAKFSHGSHENEYFVNITLPFV